MSSLPLRFEHSDIFPKMTVAIRPDLHIMMSSGTLRERLVRETATTAPLFELSYSRRGSLYGEVNGQTTELRAGYASLGFLGSASGHSEFASGDEIGLYSIWVGPKAFDAFCQAVDGSSARGFHSFQKGAYRHCDFRVDAREEGILSRLDGCFSHGGNGRGDEAGRREGEAAHAGDGRGDEAGRREGEAARAGDGRGDGAARREGEAARAGDGRGDGAAHGEGEAARAGDGLNRLLLESQVLELLSLNLGRLLDGEGGEEHPVGLSRTDREQLTLAREILLARLESPPSLLELSRLIQMNDCKLKRSFKQCFGQTVYGFVREQRLEKAFSLLREQRCNVSQSAYAVGYTNISHFSKAFRERFGIYPGELTHGKRA